MSTLRICGKCEFNHSCRRMKLPHCQKLKSSSSSCLQGHCLTKNSQTECCIEIEYYNQLYLTFILSGYINIFDINNSSKGC